MKQVRLSTNKLLLFFTCLSIAIPAEIAATCVPHTVSMATGGSGQNEAAFTTDGRLGTNNGATYFIHWDNTYLYLGWAGGNTNESSDLFYAALDVSAGGYNGSILGVNFPDPIMDYFIVYENNLTLYGEPATNKDAYEIYQASGSSSWSFFSRTGVNDGVNGRTTFGTGAGAEVRFRIPWASVGGKPTTFKIVMWANNSVGNYVWSSYPTSNPSGLGTPVTLSDGLRFSTADGVCPASSQSLETLPVSFTSFTASAEAGAAQLRWTTASERNNSHFEVERSADSRS